MKKFYLSEIAESDIDEIVTYIAQENPMAAYKFLDALFASIETLVDHPDMGHSRRDLTDKPVKFWPFKWHYLIIYRPILPLEIVRVLSASRDLVTLLG